MNKLYAVVPDDRKRKRIVSNRESAKRSRMRKQNHLGDLITEVSKLQNENKQIELQTKLLAGQYCDIALQNAAISAEMEQLTERLKSANVYLSLVEAVSGVNMDIEEISDPFAKEMVGQFLHPWLPPFSARSSQCNC